MRYINLLRVVKDQHSQVGNAFVQELIECAPIVVQIAVLILEVASLLFFVFLSQLVFVHLHKRIH